MQDRETDEAEKSDMDAAGQEPLIGYLRSQNIEMEPLLTTPISSFKGLSVTYPSSSELEVADGTNNPTSSIREKFSESTDVRGQGSGRYSCLKKQHDLIDTCTESVDFDGKRVPMMVNLEETTPASNSVKLQRDSTEQEVDIPGSESLVATEKENIAVVDCNQNLFQGDMQYGIDDDKASAVKEQNLFECEVRDNVGESIKPESVVDDHSAECIERESTSVDLSCRERIRATNMQDRETDEAEKSDMGAAGREPLIGYVRSQNIEMEPLLTTPISAFKGLSVSYPSSSELEVADGTNNPTLSIREKFFESTDVRGQLSGRNSCLKKQHDLIEAFSGSVDFDVKRGLMMVNLEETTPASNSVKLQCDSTEQEVDIPASESLVVTEKENIVLVPDNQNLFQGDMLQHANEYDLALQTLTRHGVFEDQSNIPNVDIKETASGTVDLTPPPQAEHVSKTSCMLTLGGHFERENSVSGKYIQSDCVTQADHAAEYDKCPVLVPNIIEIQEDCMFSKQSTQEEVCEDHSSEPDGNESTREDCETYLIKTPYLHRERISSNTVDGNNTKAEFVKHIPSSNLETAKVVQEEMTDFQNTSTYCMLLNSPECEASPNGDQEIQFTRPALTISHGAEALANLLEEEKSKRDNQFPLEIMIRRGDAMQCEEKSETLVDNETMSDEGSLCVERASHPIAEETGYDPLEGSPSFEGHAVSSLIVLSDQPARENENAGSETNSIHHYEKIADTDTTILTNEESIRNLVEKNTDQIRYTLAPILPLESSLLVNKGFISSVCTPLNDGNETTHEFNTLFASPVKTVSPIDEAASCHQAEMGYPRMQESLPICTVKSQRLNHGELENFTGLRENKDETILYERNVSPTVNKMVSGERSDASASVEFSGVDYASYSAFDLFTSNDGHVGDKGSDGSRHRGNVSKEDRSTEVLPLTVGAVIDPFVSDRKSDRTDYSKEACDRRESITRFRTMGSDTDSECSDDATPCTTPCDLEYEAFGTGSKEFSVGELRLSGDDEVQGMRSSPRGFVPEANTNDTSIEGDLHLECCKLAAQEKNAENFPQVGVWDSKGCKDLAQVNCRSYVGLADTSCKQSKVSDEKIAAEFIRSASKSISTTKVLKEIENEGFSARFHHLGKSKVVFDHDVEFTTGDAGGVDDSGISSDKDANENEILDVTKAAFDHKDKDGVLLLMENMKCEHDEKNHNVSNVDKDEVVAEIEKCTSDALEELADRKEDEGLIEVSKELAGRQSQIDVQFHDFTSHGLPLTCELEKGPLFNPHESISAYYEHGECNASVEVSGNKIQVKEMRLDDVDNHRDCTIMGEDFNVTDTNSYAGEDVSVVYFDPYSELNESCNDGLSEYHARQREIASDAERREATEIDEVDLFDDFGFTVSSLVPIDCNEDRGNSPASMDESFQEDTYEGKEKKDHEMRDCISTCPTDGSNVEENVKCEGEIYKEQLVCSEDAVAAYHGTVGCGDSDLNLESPIFSSWEINLFLGDGVRNSEISPTHLTLEDSAVSSCFVSDEPIFEVSANNSIDFNSKGCASGDLGEECGFKSSEGESNAVKSNPLMEFQNSEFTDLAADGGTSVVKSAWNNSETSWIQATPLKKPITVDMKENERSIKRESVSGRTVRTTMKRRALDDLPNH